MPTDTATVGHPNWPSLPLGEWEATRDTLQLWTQIVGKIRLALAPMENHWWQVPLYVNARGLTTSAMPCQGVAVELVFDFLDHRLRIQTSSGKSATVPLRPRTVADFYSEVMSALGNLDMEVRIWPRPVEIVEPIRFDQDEVHVSYDADAARRFWRLLVQVDRVFDRFRGRFLGKCSPVNFWWGSFDLSCTRFSGRVAPTHPGGIPNLADRVTREAYSHECISAGWWPGGDPVPEPSFYAYSYPVPDGSADARITPRAGYFHPQLREWILPYESVRTAADPDGMLLDFLQSTYEAAAELLGWDRAALDRR
jgi:hypothetical protein